jgi:SAM-dependent methyltransferase
MSWRDFWNSEHSIYVNARHKALHYDRIARDLAAYIPSPDAMVLDYGSGEAISAASLAEKCGALYLFDTAPNVRERLRGRFSGHPKIMVLSPDGLDNIGEASLDLVIANSLLQYLKHREFEDLLDLWQGKLKPQGQLVLADVLPPGLDAIADVKALIDFAWRGGFLMAALAGLGKTFFSDYRRLRNETSPTPLPRAERWNAFAYLGGLIALIAFADPNGGLMDIPVSFFLKNKLHLEASEVARFRLIAATPLYLSIVFGLLRDT